MTLDPGESSLRRHYNPSPLIDSAGGRGLAVFRFGTLGYAAVLVAVHREHVILWWPILVFFVVALTWSIAAPLLPRPTRAAIIVELAIACAGIFLTSVVYTPAQVTAGISTLPGVWSASPVIAGALLNGMRSGALAATVISAANLLQAEHDGRLTWHNIFLLYCLGILVGLSVQLARESQKRLEQALAADQERSLRTLITRFEPAAGLSSRSVSGEPVTDLAVVLAALRSASVEVVLPAGSVRVSAPVAEEIEAAVVAALDNVARHAGQGARVWVLLDADDRGIELTIRDNGVGMAPDRLVRAAQEGRLGASSSIRGRLLDLGGDASWRTPPGGGTTVTLTIPASHMAGSAS